jgi:hypothetical protein
MTTTRQERNMTNGLDDIIGRRPDDTPAPSTLGKLLEQDLDAWRAAKEAIGKAMGLPTAART